MDEPAPTLPEEEALYQQTLQQLKSPAKPAATSMLFVLLMLVFIAGAFGQLRSASQVVILVLVVAFHEAGHALGMRWFGFRDVQMFFIPFFGAAVSGHPRGAAAWKEAMVTLMGPLPGLVAGAALMFFGTMRQPHPNALVFHAAEVLVVLNAFNLVPLGFLDGGRFMQRVLFSRHRLLDVTFQALGSILLVFIAIGTSMHMLALFAGLSLLGLRRRWRTASAAAALRRQYADLASDPERLQDTEGRAVFVAARQIVGPAAADRSGDVALAMDAILQAAKRAPGATASVGLLALYAVALACSMAGFVGYATLDSPVSWSSVWRSGWRAEYPSVPLPDKVPAMGDVPAHTEWRTVVDGVERFNIWVTEAGPDSDWMPRAAAHLAEATKTVLVSSRAIEIGGLPGREYEFTAPDRVVRARMVATATHRYQAGASAPRWGGNQRRFLESFTVGDSLPGR